MLTKKQSELLRFINERLKEDGVPPSFDEMKEALDLRSKSGIHRLIMALEERGFIRRLPNRARALEVLRLPESSTPAPGARGGRFSPAVIEGDLGRLRQTNTVPLPGDDSGSVSIPVMGRIAAGTPISAPSVRTSSLNSVRSGSTSVKPRSLGRPPTLWCDLMVCECFWPEPGGGQDSITSG